MRKGRCLYGNLSESRQQGLYDRVGKVQIRIKEDMLEYFKLHDHTVCASANSINKDNSCYDINSNSQYDHFAC